MNKLRILGVAFIIVTVGTVISSCNDKRSTGWEFAPNMYESLAYNADQPNKNFKNGQTAQVPPAGTMPVGFDPIDEYPNTMEGYQLANTNLHTPLEANTGNLAEGKVLFVHMCSHCHGADGKGDGSIVKLGKFPPPPSYSTGVSSRGGSMKDLTDGKIFHTITNGWNLMPSHRAQLEPVERWKIVMYVHELQKAQ